MRFSLPLPLSLSHTHTYIHTHTCTHTHTHTHTHIPALVLCVGLYLVIGYWAELLLGFVYPAYKS